MAKWHGMVGYAETKETAPGVWRPGITEREYHGDVYEFSSRWSASSDSTNDNLNISNQISILADTFAYQNFRSLKYVEFMGSNWEISLAKVQGPRIILTMGGVYNGEQA